MHPRNLYKVANKAQEMRFYNYSFTQFNDNLNLQKKRKLAFLSIIKYSWKNLTLISRQVHVLL